MAHLVAGLAFSTGFMALTLARSELFTEDFLVPVITVVVRQARLRSLLRLSIVTLLANLVAGWLSMGLITAGLPELRRAAIEGGAARSHARVSRGARRPARPSR